MATTTNYSWTTPDNTAYVKDGASAIRTLGSSVDTTLFTALGGAYPGLRLVKKQTIGSGVSSVTVTGAFSATYENYKIIISGGVGSSSGTDCQLSINGSTTGYYLSSLYNSYNAATAIGLQLANQLSWRYVGSADTGLINLDAEVLNPFVAKKTILKSSCNQTITTGLAMQTLGFVNDTNSSTAFTFTPSSGTLTGGTIYVYGYGIS